MTRRVAAFGIGWMLAVLCGAAGAQTNKTLPPSASLAPQPPGIVAGAPPAQGAACTIRFVTSRGPMAVSANNTAGWVSCLQVNHSPAWAATMGSGLGWAAKSSSSGTLTVRKLVDVLSQKLRQFASSGALIPEVDIRLSRNQSGTMVPYNVYQLTNASVTAISTQLASGGRSVESVTLGYQKMQVQFLNSGSRSGRNLNAQPTSPSSVLLAPAPARTSIHGTVAVAEAQQPLLGTPGQPLLAGGTATTLMAQGSSGGSITQRQSGGSMPGSASIPSKSPGRSQFEAVTVQRGVTEDPSFTQWGNSAQPPTGHVISQIAPVPSAALTPALVGAACAKDPSLRILGVAGTTPTVTFMPGRTYTIWGCSFGPSNPNNAVYLSDGSSFTWYLQKTSWSNNSVVVSVSTRPKNPKSNLMLFVLGQNGNTKLNGVTLQ